MKEIFFNLDSGCDIAVPEKLMVAVVPACRGAGASFICGQMLQHGLPDGGTPDGMRTLVEMGRSYFYDALNMEKRLAGDGRLGQSEEEGAERRTVPSAEKPEGVTELGYYWILNHPSPKYVSERSLVRTEYAPAELLAAAKDAPGNLVLLDCSGLPAGAYLEQILALADRVYLVTDPLPTKLLESREKILWLQSRCSNMQFLVNKYNRGVFGGELTRFLGTGNYLVQEMLPAEKVYRAEYRSELP